MKNIFVFGLAILLAFIQPASAQVALPTVAKIQDFFSPVVAEIDAGAQPRLVSLGTPASQKLLNHALQVRIFTLNADSNRPEPELGRTRGNCELFISSTYPVRVVGNTLELMQTDYKWLDALTLEGKVRNGRYWMVLETAAVNEGDFLLLDRSQKEQYFGSGLLLVIKPTMKPANEQIIEAFRERRKALEVVQLKIEGKLGGMTCYGFKKLVVDSGADYSEQIAACTVTAADRNS